MNNLLLKLLSGFNFWQLVMLIYRAGGRDAVAKFFTIPQSVLAKAETASIPGRLTALVEERDEVVEEIMELIDASVDEEWIDPD